VEGSDDDKRLVRRVAQSVGAAVRGRAGVPVPTAAGGAERAGVRRSDGGLVAALPVAARLPLPAAARRARRRRGVFRGRAAALRAAGPAGRRAVTIRLHLRHRLLHRRLLALGAALRRLRRGGRSSNKASPHALLRVNFASFLVQDRPLQRREGSRAVPPGRQHRRVRHCLILDEPVGQCSRIKSDISDKNLLNFEYFVFVLTF